jgi:hypothetical protein
VVEKICGAVESLGKCGRGLLIGAGLCPVNVLVVDRITLDSDNAGDGGCGLCTMEPMTLVAKVGVLAEGIGLGTREALSEMVLHQTSDGVAEAC